MKTKILFIMHMPPPVHGASMVGKYIHDSQLINDSFDCKFINLATAKNVEDIGKFSMRKFNRYFTLRKQVKKAVKEFQPDLVYVTPNATGFAFWKDYMIVQMVKKMGCKVILHYHNKGVSKRQGKRMYDRLYSSFFKDAKVILLADSLYDDIHRYVAMKDVVVCANGAPQRKTVAAGDKNNHPTQILFLSNLIVAKGPIEVLNACRMLADKGYDFQCNIVGSETDELNEMTLNSEIAMRHIDNHVKYLGKKYDEEKEAIYDKSDIFVFPTYYENECFPLVLLEAMQHSLPCVSTKEGGILDIIDDGVTGFIVKRKDSIDLADKLSKLLDDAELRRKMGEAGHKKYQEHYTLELFEQRLKKILEDAAK